MLEGVDLLKDVIVPLVVGVGTPAIVGAWVTFSKDGKAFWSKLGTVEYQEPGVLEPHTTTRVFELRGVRTVFVVAVIALAFAVGTLIAFIMRAPGVPLPPGVIVASDVECSSLGGNWTEFSSARGRFLVGADPSNDSGTANFDELGRALSKHKIHDHAGLEKVKLSSTQIPALDVDVFADNLKGETSIGSLLVQGGSEVGVLSEKRSTGHFPFITWKTRDGTNDVSIMPPFFSVYFCKKG